MKFKKTDFKFKEFQKLPFNTKFNVNVKIDIYKKWDLFIKLNEFFKNKTKQESKNFIDVV